MCVYVCVFYNSTQESEIRTKKNMAATEDKHILQLSVAYADSSVLTLLQQQLKFREKKSHIKTTTAQHTIMFRLLTKWFSTFKRWDIEVCGVDGDFLKSPLFLTSFCAGSLGKTEPSVYSCKNEAMNDIFRHDLRHS